MNFDILVVGAGPAGLSAALTAAQAGVRVGLVDDNARAGGQVWRQGPVYAGQRSGGGPAGEMFARLDGFARSGRIVHLAGTRVVQTLPGRQLLAEAARGAHVLGYDRLVVASGARERFLPYPGWTLPGVTGAGGLQALVKGGMDVRGERIVVAGSGPLLLAAAHTARQRGAHVVALIEQASAAAVRRFAAQLVHTPGRLGQALQMRFALRATPYWRDAHVIEACGDTRLTHVRVRRGNQDVSVACDRLACAYGLVPDTSLGAALGCRIDERPPGDALDAGIDAGIDAAIAVDAWQATSVGHVYAAGECTGVGGRDLSMVEGRIAAYAAMGERARAQALFAERERHRRFAARLHVAFALDARLRSLAGAQTTFCRCEDVPFGAVAQHRSWRDAKLHTRCGMGSCQGKICGTAASFCFGWTPGSPRPPLAPARIDSLLAVRAED